jgi:malate dehydrogenase
MPDVAIIGAGTLGGELARVLARRNAAAIVRLIDDKGQIAAGKALDLMQSAPIEGFATTISGSTDLTTAASADVILVADRADGAEWRSDDGLLLLNRLLQLGTTPVVVCAGAGARELVERGNREAKYSRERLFGSAPEALRSAVRAIVGAETSGSPRDVALTVLGVPPSQIVVPWEEATIGGFAATSVLDEPARRRLASKVAPLWPPGPYALAWAAAKTIEAIFEKTRQTIAAFVAPDDSNGRRFRAAALPVRLGPRGIVAVELPQLNARDRVALDNAILL